MISNEWYAEKELLSYSQMSVLAFDKIVLQ